MTSIACLVKEAKDWAVLADWEAWERLLRMEVESVTSLASAREEVEGLARRITLLKGELAEAHWAREMVKENF
jgi:hypothetical protein